MKRFLHIALVLICACSGSEETEVQVINLDNLPEKEFNFLDLMVEPEVIPLETVEESLISSYTRYLVGEKYIIAANRNKILLFSRDGKFIRKVANSGNGPGEFNGMGDFDLGPNGDKLYLLTRANKTVLLYDLTRDSYKEILLPGSISDITLIEENTLLATGDSRSDYLFFTLDVASGEILSKEVQTQEAGPPARRGIFFETNEVGETFLLPAETDTLYQFANGQLNPYMFFNFSNKIDKEKTSKGFDLAVSYVTENFMLLYKTEASLNIDGGGVSYGTMSAEPVFMDRKSKEVYTYDMENVMFSMLLSKGEMGFVMGPEFFGDSENEQNPITSQLVGLIEEKYKPLTPEDNPVIVIGKIGNLK